MRLPALGSGGGSYTYVDDAQPDKAEEGETWYDTDGNAAYVFDGAAWVELTITSHGELSGVSAGDHRSDSNIRSTVDGQVDAETVDGQHASDLGAPSYTDSTLNRWTVTTSLPTYGTVDVFYPIDYIEVTNDSNGYNSDTEVHVKEVLNGTAHTLNPATSSDEGSTTKSQSFGSPVYVSRISTSGDWGDYNSITADIRFVTTEEHNHPI